MIARLGGAQAARASGFGASCVVLVVLMAIFCAAPVAPYDPLKQDLSAACRRRVRRICCGTDNTGRDVLARVIWGTRVSLIAGLVSVAIGVVVGCADGPGRRLLGRR